MGLLPESVDRAARAALGRRDLRERAQGVESSVDYNSRRALSASLCPVGAVVPARFQCRVRPRRAVAAGPGWAPRYGGGVRRTGWAGRDGGRYGGGVRLPGRD